MDFTKYETFLETAKVDPRAVNCDIKSILFENQPMVLVHPDLGDVPTLTLASCFEVQDTGTTGSGKLHHVFSFYDGKGMHFKCDDELSNGTKDTAPSLIDQALATSPFALSEEKKTELRKSLNDNVGATAKDAACWFWQAYKSADPKLCKHTNTVLKEHGATLWQDLETAWEKFSAPERAQDGPDEGMTLAKLAFNIPVLYEGERGTGKTYEAREFARTNKYHLVELAGHESIEAQDLLGYYAPSGDGKHVWKDGKMAQAFRKAAAGEKVVLLIDELLRIPQRQLSVLLTALSPDTDGTYKLSTNRIVRVEDGVGVDETISAPVKNLCVVATTNSGQGYAVDEIDPAMAERFIPIRKESSLDQIRAVLGKESVPKGLQAAVEPTVQFYIKAKMLFSQGQLEREPSMRTLVRAFTYAAKDSVKDVCAGLKGQALLWVARDSNAVPLPEQLQAINRLADDCFSAGRMGAAKAKDVTR